VTPERLQVLLDGVAAGEIPAAEAMDRLRRFPLESLEFATIDHHRALRQGQPEVVYCAGKTDEQVLAICERLAAANGGFFGTRATASQGGLLEERFPGTVWNPQARTVFLRAPSADGAPAAQVGRILVVSAGTSDLPVAEEAAVTAEVFGHEVGRLCDVGVAGIHRLLAATDRLAWADVVIVVAGMEGALPSVVGGLVACPVIAVPTSVGYGAAFGGLAALLGMLNSCASGLTVVNIDNGFGAAAAASRILRRR
jgi:NCAIR mutase (PurE)-related protein